MNYLMHCPFISLSMLVQDNGVKKLLNLKVIRYSMGTVKQIQKLFRKFFSHKSFLLKKLKKI